MAVSYPDPAGGTMTVANQAEAEARGWTPSMGTLGAYSQDANFKPATSGGGTQQQQQQQQQQLQQGGGLDALLQALQAGDQRAFDESVRQFNATYGLDTRKFEDDIRRFNASLGIQQAGVTGTYQGAPTLPALTSYATQFGTWGAPQVGAQTLAAQQQAYEQQMGAINAAAQLQANPFRQQQVIGQLGGLLGGQGVAAFQAPNTVAGVGTAGGNTRGGMGYLQTLIDDIRDPTPNTTSMSQVLNAIPTPTKLNSVEFARAAPSTQSMVLQGMQEKYGLDPNDALKQIQATLPQFTAPTAMGQIRR